MVMQPEGLTGVWSNGRDRRYWIRRGRENAMRRQVSYWRARRLLLSSRADQVVAGAEARPASANAPPKGGPHDALQVCVRIELVSWDGALQMRFAKSIK